MSNIMCSTCVDISENNVYLSKIAFVTLLQSSFDEIFFLLQWITRSVHGKSFKIFYNEVDKHATNLCHPLAV